MDAAPTGLRERKKRKTRQAIVDAAMPLFEQRGFGSTTVAEIADAAEIAPRTFFAYFPSKDDVVFADFQEVHEAMRTRLRDRRPGETAIDAMRAWIAEIVEHADFDDERERLRRRLIRDNESLAAHNARLLSRLEDSLANAVGEDLGDAADELRPRLVAVAAVAALDTLGSFYDESGRVSPERPMEVVDQAMAFLRAGLVGLRGEGSWDGSDGTV